MYFVDYVSPIEITEYVPLVDVVTQSSESGDQLRNVFSGAFPIRDILPLESLLVKYNH